MQCRPSFRAGQSSRIIIILTAFTMIAAANGCGRGGGTDGDGDGDIDADIAGDGDGDADSDSDPCEPEDDDELCENAGRDCGDVTIEDRCGDSQTIDCGSCRSPQTCGGGGVSNVCGCESESTTSFCSRHRAQCGTVTGEDNCDESRTERCGGCDADEACSSNRCVCDGESEGELCAMIDASCGEWTITDRCDDHREVTCGTCRGGETCGGGFAAVACGRAICTGDGWCRGSEGIPGAVDVWDLTVFAIWTHEDDDGWAVAGVQDTLSRVFRWYGGGWIEWGDVSGIGLFALWGDETDSVWTAGGYGEALFYDGDEWTGDSIGRSIDISGLWGLNENDVWATGYHYISSNHYDSRIAHYDGIGWSESTLEGAKLRGVWSAAWNDVWVVGDHGTDRAGYELPAGDEGYVAHYDGSGWSEVALPEGTPGINDIWGSSSDDVWIVGSTGTILRWTGDGWIPHESGTEIELRDVMGSGSDAVWAVGFDGMIVHWNGSAWVRENGGTTADLFTLWVREDLDVWASGEDGIFLHREL